MPRDLPQPQNVVLQLREGGRDLLSRCPSASVPRSCDSGACPRCFMVAKLHPCPLLPAGAAPAAPSCSILALRSTREGNSRLLRTNCPSSLTSRFTFTRNASKRCPLPCGTGTAPPLAAGQSGRHREQPSAEFQTMPAEFQTMPTPSREFGSSSVSLL